MDIRLYIGDRQVDLSNNVDILFNWQETDLSNPTVIKNGYSKTIVVEGTNNNNDIFGHFWNLERYQTYGGYAGVDYNPSYRVPFTLYYDGAIYERGYVKLQKVTKLDKEYNYEIGLFGGLGSFLYNLSTDWTTGGKKTLADLTYYATPESENALDLGFTINKETVASAWTEVNTNSKFGCINFAPTYNGLPTNLDSDKVLINFSGASFEYSGSPFYSSTTVDDKTFKTYRGYALGKLPDKLTSEMVKDYRSYLQTPVIRCKNVIEALCRPENNKGKYDEGYEVVLDDDFFTSTNPYYWNSYLTLNRLSLIPSGGEAGQSIDYGDIVPFNDYTLYDSQVRVIALPINASGQTGTVKVSFKLRITVPDATADELHMVFRGGLLSRYQGHYDMIAIQGYTSNSMTEDENVFTASKLQWVSESVGFVTWKHGQLVYSPNYMSVDELTESGRRAVDALFVDMDIVGTTDYDGYFTKVSSGVYEFNHPIEFEVDFPSNAKYLKIKTMAFNVQSNYIVKQYGTVLSTTKDSLSSGFHTYDFLGAMLNKYDADYKFINKSTTNDYSNRDIPQDKLLNTSFSPAEFLVSYCKTFGLYLYKDTVEDKIYISTRNNFFKKEDILNLEDILDVSKGVEINPIYVDTNYVSLTNKPVEGEFYQNYFNKYGKKYGTKIVNTGYEFNADTKELCDSIIFKNAIQAKEQSQYFFQKNSINPYVVNGFSYLLYENGDNNGETTDVEIPKAEIVSTFAPFDAEYPYYDFMSKANFEDASHKGLDTEGVLLFYNGLKAAPTGYYITDDNSYMTFMNNNPCWIMTDSEYDSNGNRIAIEATHIPRFSRYFEGNHWMTYSMDFGSPRELYVPDMTSNEEAYIYYNYHKKYFEDLYDINTRVITCFVKSDILTEENLRNIYWFRNGLWRLNRVFDYNPATPNTTKCEFIKIQDLGNLSNEDATTELRIRITLDRYEIGASGGTIIGTVWTSDNYGWEIESVGYNPSGGSQVTITPETDTQGGNFIVSVPSNGGPAREVTINVNVRGLRGSVTFLQEGYGDFITITAISPIDATATTINYTVNSSDECRVRLSGGLIPSFVQHDHPSGITNSSFTISANTETYEQYYSLLAWDLFNVSVSAATSVEQLGATPATITGITLNASWATDVPASGGTASYLNCNYTVTAHYSDSTSADVTTQADMSLSTSFEVSATTSETRQNVGTISVIASYYDGPNPFTSSQTVSAYQAAYVPPIPTVTWQAYNRSEWNVYGNLHTGSTQDYAGLEVLSGETEDHNQSVPVTLTSAYLALSPAPANPSSYSIVLSNSTYGDSMMCIYDSVNGAWVGTGSVRLEQGTILDIAVVQL